MPVVEFALDAAAQHRVQVHLPEEQSAAVTILLNRSILGSLTSDEQTTGKDFRLPDNSLLNVRVINGQPQVSRAGYTLPSVDAAHCEGAGFFSCGSGTHKEVGRMSGSMVGIKSRGD